TTGADTVSGTSGDDTVNATAATLNAGDQLTGGAGTDVLALYGSGEFRGDQLAVFTGFESITLNNFTGGGGTVYLGNSSITVTGYGSGSEVLVLGSGAVTFMGGGNRSEAISESASNWNAGNAIDGGSGYGNVSLNSSGSDNAIYDLTTNTLTHSIADFRSGRPAKCARVGLCFQTGRSLRRSTRAFWRIISTWPDSRGAFASIEERSSSR